MRRRAASPSSLWSEHHPVDCGAIFLTTGQGKLSMSQSQFTQFRQRIKILFNNMLDKTFISVWTLMIITGVIRQVLEASWGHMELTPIYFTNTITYVYLMLIAEGFIINKFLKGNHHQLRQLIHEGSLKLLILFILIPVLNMIFTNAPFYFRVWYDLPLPFPHFKHYGPFGIHVAFLLIIFYLPFWLRRLYQIPIYKIIRVTLPVYTIHYLLYYQITMYFFFQHHMPRQWSFNAWSASFLAPVLIILPDFIHEYPNTHRERIEVQIFQFSVWLTFIIVCIF